MRKIVYSTPFRQDKNIGKYYNEFCERLNEGEYACFTDGDAAFTTHDFGTQMERIIRKYPKGALFTCMTNRVYNKDQLIGGKISEERDFGKIWQTGRKMQEKHYMDVELLDDPNKLLSGVLMLLPKSTNDRYKFKDGCLGVDNDIHKRLIEAGEKVYLMKGVYVFHYYRANGEGKAHLLAG